MLTVVIGILIIWNSRAVLVESFNILMQATPENLDIPGIKQSIEALDQVDNLHHVHVWRLNDDEIHFECHVDLKRNLRISDADRLRNQIEKILKNDFFIRHVTLQMEYGSCNTRQTVGGAKQDS